MLFLASDFFLIEFKKKNYIATAMLHTMLSAWHVPNSTMRSPGNKVPLGKELIQQFWVDFGGTKKLMKFHRFLIFSGSDGGGLHHLEIFFAISTTQRETHGPKQA